MLLRLVAGAAGVGVMLTAFTWPELMPALKDRLATPAAGSFTAFAIMFGVYLMFFGLTGDWLPRLTRLKDRR